MSNEQVPDPEKPAEGDGEPDSAIPEAARQILEEIEKAKKATVAPSSQPNPADAQAAWAAQRDNFKKQMNFTEEQMALYERDKAATQAPLMQEISISKIERSQKDFEQLKEPFLAEVKSYAARGQLVTPELAEQIFFMIKGREISAGRYTQPSSQPAPVGRTPVPAGAGTSPQRRIAPGYNPGTPGVGGGSEGEGGDQEAQLSEEEKTFASRLSVDFKDYQKMKDEKSKGIREIADRSYRAPQIDSKTAGPADRDLASLWSKNGGKI